MERAIVFLNGELKGSASFYQQYISSADDLFCADGGAKYTYQLDLIPQLIVGDLDSISDKVTEFYKDNNVEFEKYPVEKDKSDTEILLESLLAKEYDEIILFAALGKRFDHTLANLYLLEKVFNQKTTVKIITPEIKIEVIKDKKMIKEQQGEIISLFSLSDKVEGINLTGFKYELENGTLERGSSLGLSNIIKEQRAEIKIKSGTLLVIFNY
ncbi:MAG: thiamine diphosphokinase [Bacillota bacterium]